MGDGTKFHRKVSDMRKNFLTSTPWFSTLPFPPSEAVHSKKLSLHNRKRESHEGAPIPSNADYSNMVLMSNYQCVSAIEPSEFLLCVITLSLLETFYNHLILDYEKRIS